MKTLFAAAALAAVTTAAPALAQDSSARGHGKGDFMETYDLNKDGKVTSDEFSAQRGESYKGLDLDQDGQVNEMEYVTEYNFRLDQEQAEQRARQIRQAHVRFGVLDADKNAAMSAAEFKESGARMFSRLDTNSDGVVDSKDTAKSF